MIVTPLALPALRSMPTSELPSKVPLVTDTFVLVPPLVKYTPRPGDPGSPLFDAFTLERLTLLRLLEPSISPWSSLLTAAILSKVRFST